MNKFQNPNTEEKSNNKTRNIYKNYSNKILLTTNNDNFNLMVKNGQPNEHNENV